MWTLKIKLSKCSLNPHIVLKSNKISGASKNYPFIFRIPHFSLSIILYVPGVLLRTLPPSLLHHPGMNFCSKYKPKKYFVIEFLDEVAHAEHLNIAVDVGNSLGKTVIVDTTNKVCYETASYVQVNAGEDKLV